MANLKECAQNPNEASLVPQTVFVPEVDEAMRPRMGMHFESVKEAEAFYKRYTRIGGFEVRSSSTKFSSDRTLTDKFYVCSNDSLEKRKGEGCVVCQKVN